MRKLMKLIPAIAILVLASACAAGPVDPMTDDVVMGDELEETASAGDQTQDQSPDLRRNLRLARVRR